MPTNSTTESKQVCNIRILFPVDTDEQAIEYKKKITALLVEIPEANITFGLSTMPMGLPPKG